MFRRGYLSQASVRGKVFSLLSKTQHVYFQNQIACGLANEKHLNCFVFEILGGAVSVWVADCTSQESVLQPPDTHVTTAWFIMTAMHHVTMCAAKACESYLVNHFPELWPYLWPRQSNFLAYRIDQMDRIDRILALIRNGLIPYWSKKSCWIISLCKSLALRTLCSWLFDPNWVQFSNPVPQLTWHPPFPKKKMQE